MNVYEKATELAILVTGLEADASETFGMTKEYARYLGEFPNMLVMMETSEVIEGILVDADLDEGKIVVAVAEPDADFDEVEIAFSKNEFMKETIRQQAERMIIDAPIRVYIGAKSPYDVSATIRVSDGQLLAEFEQKVLWLEAL